MVSYAGSGLLLEAKKWLTLERELKEIIVSALDLEDIAPEDIESDEPLFAKGLGLDSIDGLELGVAISKKYKIKVQGSKEEIRAIFETVGQLARYLAGQESTDGLQRAHRGGSFPILAGPIRFTDGKAHLGRAPGRGSRSRQHRCSRSGGEVAGIYGT